VEESAFEVEIVLVFEVSLHLVDFQLKLYLSENQTAQCFFYFHAHVLVFSELDRRPLCNCGSEESVLAREQHLDEVPKVKFVVLVQIKVQK
jgi:hypothetical protein